MEIQAGKLTQTPWIHLRERFVPRPRPIDVNSASKADLRTRLKLTPRAIDRIQRARKKRPFRDLTDLAKRASLTKNQVERLAGLVIGSLRPEVVIHSTEVRGKRLFSEKPWAIDIEFSGPTCGRVVLAAVAVRWRGEPFVAEHQINRRQSEEGKATLRMSRKYALPAGPCEVMVTLYDDLGGASSQPLEAWVLPSNPFTLLTSPANRSIYNGSVRPDWNSPNWTTGMNLTFINGDSIEMRLNRTVTWKFWNGGVGGSLVESGTFTWPHQINVSAYGQYAGWISFSSPPGSGIYNKYEDMEDMTIELIFTKQSGGAVTATITCRIMGGWGINIIKVGSFTSSQDSSIAAGVNDTRDVYENHGLTFSSVQWWSISNSDAGGYTVLNDEDEWGDLLDDWTVPNNSVDCFVVRDLWDSYAGWSPIGGPDEKDDKDDGLAVDWSMVCFTHELGHYMGDLGHANSLGTSNVMHSTCGGRNFTYDQYKDFFDHGWTRIVR